MGDHCTKHPIYVETVGLSTAVVYLNNGVYSVFLVGDQVVCFLGDFNSFGDCRRDIESLKELVSAVGMS